jgi:hypothetical protein
MAIRPVGKSFLFAFINETRCGIFTQKNKGLIYLPNANTDVDRQGEFARFAKVLAVGERVTDFKNGDVVLISALKWTKGFVFDEIPVWKSDQDQVLAIYDSKDLSAISYDFYASTRDA